MTSEEPTKRTRRTLLKSASLATIPVIGIASGATGIAAADSTITDEEPHEEKTYNVETSLAGAPYPYDESKQVTSITIAYYGTREAPHQGGDEYDYESVFRTMVNTTVLVRETGDEWTELEIDQDDSWAETPVDWTLTQANLDLELAATDGHIDDSGLYSAVGSSWGKADTIASSDEVIQNLAGILLGEAPIIGDVLTINNILGGATSGADEYSDGETERSFLWQYPYTGESIHTAHYTFSIFHSVVRGIQFDISYDHDLPNSQASRNNDTYRGFDWYDLEYPDNPQIPR